jgi:type II secretory pathway component PulK
VSLAIFRRARRRRGIVLIAALIVLLIVVAVVLQLARESRVQVNVATRELDEVQVRAICESGVDRALVALATDDSPGDTLYDKWRFDEGSFRAIQVGEGKFWVGFAEEDPGDGQETTRWGVRDEAAKLNVNLATRDQLLKLPGMTDQIADSILDWRDADEDTRESGAESSYYNSLTPAYGAKNAPIESLEELLRVQGIDESVLYGEDRNLNGLLDPGENDPGSPFPPNNGDGLLQRGLIDYLTVFSSDRNVTKDGRQRMNIAGRVNPADFMQRLTAAGMAADEATRIIGWATRRNAPPIRSIADFLDAPGVDEAAFAILADELSTTDALSTPGKININTASKEVISCIPGLTDDEVQAIVGARVNGEADLSSPAWLLRVLNKTKVKAAFDYVTTNSYQFTIHVAAALDKRPSVVRRISVLVDRGYSPPRILLRRDLTPLGFPFPGERGEKVP